ncbi:hypothetical protein NOM01_16880 [Sporolactobacillus sp. STSJ-5]|uniref:hypothetical protein n=1 Tax=Sporolactobacillus sp. STSJ-5 TaxID=2965076 RepID=UPI0021072963|nr:hypothetical protein [Sporolactobacillus sp. STSJ-5]MCQ2011658.1 hypothetical protein [Sporolactobacillus sp. STSJ-5]
MRHWFNFPLHVRNEVKRHINNAIERTDPRRYNQESQYITSLLAKLEGELYEDDIYKIQIIATVMDDRGKKSAESIWGADFAITADIMDNYKNLRIIKAILFQAKMSTSDLKSKKLKQQIIKMKKLTKSPKVLIVNPVGNNRYPYVCSGNKVLIGSKYTKEKLAEYFTKRILTTFDGDTRKSFVDVVQNSGLPQIHLSIIDKRDFYKFV